MNKDLEVALDRITTQRLVALNQAIAICSTALMESAAKQVVIIGTKTATGSVVYLARRAKIPAVQEVMIRQLATFSPLREEYRSQLQEIVPDVKQLTLLYAMHDHAAFSKPLWHEIADTFDVRKMEDIQQLERILQV